jgi:hypothetical protein
MDKLVKVGVAIAVSGFIFGVLGCGYLANNETNGYILLSFGCLFIVGMLLVGVGLVGKRWRGKEG